MKRIKNVMVMMSILTVAFSFTACGSREKTVQTDNEVVVTTEEKNKQEATTEQTKNQEDALEEQADIVEKDVEDTVASLNEKYEQLKSEISTYEAYLQNSDKMEAFYNEVYETNYMLCIRMYEYSLEYAELIINSDKSYDDMYDDLDEIYEVVYDDSGDDIYDEIYDDLLSDMYDDYYDGILDDAYDDAPYDEWSDARSDEYDWWSDTRSDVYDTWSDFRSDVYDFWSDLRSDIWDDDIESAKSNIEDFREDIDKVKQKSGLYGDNSESEEMSESESDEAEQSDKTVDSNQSDVIRPEIKDALDSYEAFFDEYCEFMKTYSESDDPASLMSEYAEFIQQYAETMGKLDEMEQSDLTDAELLYYTEVMARITQKLAEVSVSIGE